ncbi:hypothetical protein KP509_14G012800 [Ceratopteris richardii]|uniref:Uncharacterized protein n=1 Tax=Ceratopteris richardii TaxID=49495 RepID=A0A8T2T5R0_CERRI|nr:hypothetical protein KP509_14G012800 [Ceratopteris richardii]
MTSCLPSSLLSMMASVMAAVYLPWTCSLWWKEMDFSPLQGKLALTVLHEKHFLLIAQRNYREQSILSLCTDIQLSISKSFSSSMFLSVHLYSSSRFFVHGYQSFAWQFCTIEYRISD